MVLAIGFFDGFHRGHRAIITGLLQQRRPGFRAAVLTFRNHPTTYLRPAEAPPMISTLEERLNHLGRAGVDEAYLLPFDAAIATIEAQTFLDDIVIGRLGARTLVVGQNFRFGRNRGGDVAFAKLRMEERGLGFAAVAQLEDRGERVSSTRIRAAISSGNMELADELLGGSYELRGRVVVGEGRGHDLGFPTANIEAPAGKVIPAEGVYRCTARFDGRDYAALLSIGTNPTFDGKARTIEVWLRDFDRAIYGEEVALRDLRFLREQKRFENAEALLEQMRADVASVPYPSFV
ncbi:MAG: riboflavin biosynthesis protein RibF, partial [Vulcanimicrobiaceae bacterium]